MREQPLNLPNYVPITDAGRSQHHYKSRHDISLRRTNRVGASLLSGKTLIKRFTRSTERASMDKSSGDGDGLRDVVFPG